MYSIYPVLMSLVIVQVDSNMKLGEWAGLCKIDQEGKARKVLGDLPFCRTNGRPAPGLLIFQLLLLPINKEASKFKRNLTKEISGKL